MYGFGITLYQTNKITFTRPPGNIQQPYIVGDPMVGIESVCNPGVWENNTSQFKYQWKIDGVNIRIATTNKYTPIASDAGKNLSCVVTASNVYGSGSVETRGIVVTS
jgi:hypothetical protein